MRRQHAQVAHGEDGKQGTRLSDAGQVRQPRPARGQLGGKRRGVLSTNDGLLSSRARQQQGEREQRASDVGQRWKGASPAGEERAASHGGMSIAVLACLDTNHTPYFFFIADKSNPTFRSPAFDKLTRAPHSMCSLRSPAHAHRKWISLCAVLTLFFHFTGLGQQHATHSRKRKEAQHAASCG